MIYAQYTREIISISKYDKRKLPQNIVAIYWVHNEIPVNIYREKLEIRSSKIHLCDIRRNLHISRIIGHRDRARGISNLRQCAARIGIRMRIHCVLSMQDKTIARTHLFSQVCKPIIEWKAQYDDVSLINIWNYYFHMKRDNISILHYFQN